LYNGSRLVFRRGNSAATFDTNRNDVS
jgi:hypothetical protein